MNANIFGFSFYACDESQFSSDLFERFCKAEAILFSEKDLENSRWETAWRNIQKVASIIGNTNLSFHFPMNNCDYVNNRGIRQKLLDALIRAESIGLSKIVVHPNLTYSIPEWRYLDRTKMRTVLHSTIESIMKEAKTAIPLCIENMPPIGNLCDDADSAILFTSDFSPMFLYTFDICHYFNVVETMNRAKTDGNLRHYLAEVQECSFLDFIDVLPLIAHYHFSAFDRIAYPPTRQFCHEGLIPQQSNILSEQYTSAIRIIANDCIRHNKTIISDIVLP